MATRVMPWRRIRRKTSLLCAPSAIRIPSSRVRCATEYEITPYKPIAARTNAVPGENAEEQHREFFLEQRPRDHVVHASADSRAATDLFTLQTACWTAGKRVSGFSGEVRTAMLTNGHIPWPSGW